MRSILVTGGSRGLGLGIGHALASAGFRVIAVARREGEELAATRAAIEREGRGALHFRAFDLADIDGIADFVKLLTGEFGALYGLVNNAGLGTSGILATLPESAIARLIMLNVTSPIMLTKYAVRSMMPRREGRIVNISSIVSTTGYSGLTVYSATKASLVGFTRSLAREVGSLGISVNAVAPGFVDTEMTHGLTAAHRGQIIRRSALQRMAETADIADAVKFLLSDAARNITGTTLTVDAGSTA